MPLAPSKPQKAPLALPRPVAAPLQKPQPPKATKRRGPGRPAGKFTQVSRLHKLRELLEREPSGVAIADIAVALRITPRSVRRYLEALAAKTPLQSIPTTPGGPHKWRIKPIELGRSVTLRRTQAFGLLSTKRVLEGWRGSAFFDELDVALSQIRAVGGRATKGGSTGEAVLDVKLDERFFYLPPPGKSFQARGEDLDALFEATAKLEPLSLKWKRARADKAERITIHPYALVSFGGSIFIVGPEAGKEECEVYAFEHTSDLRPIEKSRFFLPAEFDLSAYLHGTFGVAKPSRERVVVEFDARVADEVRSKKVHPAQKVGTSPDGRVRLSFPLANPDAIASFVLSFADAARVVTPEPFARELAARLDRARARYEAPLNAGQVVSPG